MVTASLMGAAQPPSLVVGIFVQGLTSDRLDQLRGLMQPDGGLRRLLERGVVVRDAEFGPRADATAGTAMLLTGAAPVVNGIPSARVYDPKRKVEQPILADGSRGTYANSTFTPEAVLVSTLTDEIRVSTDGAGAVHALAPDAQMAVIMAGHAGSSANWLDPADGHWATTTYFRETPAPLARRNNLLPLARRLDTMAWAPMLNPDLYPDLPAYRRQMGFKHAYKGKGAERVRQFLASPLAGRETTQAAADYIASLSLGNRGVVDVLNLGYDVTPYPYGREADVRLETMDAYLRLDADLGSLFRAIDQSGPGMDRTVVFVAGLPAAPRAPQPDPAMRIPTGQFSPQRALSLLNLYLVALHGNGDYVTGWHDGYFYLNRELLRQREMSLQNVRTECADFLARMEGVSQTFTIDDIRAGRAGDKGERLRANTDPRRAGDVLVLVNPGWRISDEPETTNGKKHKNAPQAPVIAAAPTSAPVLIMAPGLAPDEIVERVDARAIAPTVARLLRIRSPNAATTAPLKLNAGN